MGRINIRALLAALACAALHLAACGGSKASQSGSGPSQAVASAPAEAAAASTSPAAAPATAAAPVNAKASGEAAAPVVMGNKPACKLLKQSEMTAVLGRPVEAIGFGNSAEYACSFGAESTGNLPVNKSIPYYVMSGVELHCGGDAKTMRPTWYIPNDSSRAPGARYDIRINLGVASYFLMLPTGCAAMVAPANDIHPFVTLTAI